MSTNFYLFTYLPAELQRIIWSFAVRPAKPGVQIFGVVSDRRSRPNAEGTYEVLWNEDYFLTAPKWAFGLMCTKMGALDNALASWTKNNPSTYVIDSGIWNACTHSHQIMRSIVDSTEPMVVQKKAINTSQDIAQSGPRSLPSQERTIIVSPTQDLFILQLDDPNMFTWSLFNDSDPQDIVPRLTQIRHVGWQYHPVWASNIQEFNWIGSLKSLYSYIIYGVRFGGLETLWLINYHIRRKYWVPSRAEVEGPGRQVFETDVLRFTEVCFDDDILSFDQLQWCEANTEDGLYTESDFLDFVRTLRRFLAYILAKQLINIKILAYDKP